MVFTTHFGLQSQTTRLWEGRGVAPSAGPYGPDTRYGQGPDQEDLDPTPDATTIPPNATVPVDEKSGDSALGSSLFTRRY